MFFFFNYNVPNQTFTKPEVKGESRKRGLGEEPPAGECCGAVPPKMVALVVCPLKTNEGVYS